MSTHRYDRIGRTYSSTRRADPRIAARIEHALDGAERIVNIGAGAGSYEPARLVAAVDPSAVMLEQRHPSAAPAVRGVAEALPFHDDAFDAAMLILTIHHWSDWRAGLAEVRRVASKIVLLGWDVDHGRFWLTDEYVPYALALDADAPTMDELAQVLGKVRVETVPVPTDCTDGFCAAYWARPEAYLDPTVRAGISCCARLDQDVLAPRMDALANDLSSGAWDERHGRLRQLTELDLGYRLVSTT